MLHPQRPMPGLLLGRECGHPVQQGSALGGVDPRIYPVPRAGLLRQAIADHGALGHDEGGRKNTRKSGQPGKVRGSHRTHTNK